MMSRNQFIEYLDMMLETESLEDFLERYNITPEDAVMRLYDCGLIDEDYADAEAIYTDYE